MDYLPDTNIITAWLKRDEEVMKIIAAIAKVHGLTLVTNDIVAQKSFAPKLRSLASLEGFYRNKTFLDSIVILITLKGCGFKMG
jgi:hypothetical protein